MSAVAPATILVVDDDCAIRTLVQGLLGREGFATVVAESAEEALVLFREHEPSIALLVTDVNMPGASGPELARHLQKLKPELRVLCMSASSELFDQAFEGFACLPKPFTIRELMHRVGELLQQRKGMTMKEAEKERKLKSG